MRVLFITRKSERCGVADYGKRLFSILATAIDIILCETETDVDPAGYDIALYNYHYATMPFITTGHPGVKHIGIFHEAHLNHGFDKMIPVQSLPRPLMNYIGNHQTNTIPVIGSFGFGFPSKNFPGLAAMVKEQFTNAILRLNIPFAEFGDANGVLAMSEADKCRQVLGDRVQITHNYMNQQQLLDWCAGNDLNAFLYHPSAGRGLSSCTDYALSVKRPVAISGSEMFRHLPRSIVAGNLAEIMNNGIKPLDRIYWENSNERLIEAVLKQLND